MFISKVWFCPLKKERSIFLVLPSTLSLPYNSSVEKLMPFELQSFPRSGPFRLHTQCSSVCCWISCVSQKLAAGSRGWWNQVSSLWGQWCILSSAGSQCLIVFLFVMLVVTGGQCLHSLMHWICKMIIFKTCYDLFASRNALIERNFLLICC